MSASLSVLYPAGIVRGLHAMLVNLLAFPSARGYKEILPMIIPGFSPARTGSDD
ncbi:MAG: hypothetical protein WA891_00230 [Acidobacteriaceae bacterium]